MTEAQLVILFTTIAGFLTTLSGLGFTYVMSERKRRWEIEDRRLIAETLAAKVEQKAAEVKHDFDAAKMQIVSSADRAFNESNSLNTKLKAVTMSNNSQFEELLRAAMPTDTLDTIDKTTTETAAKVDDIHRELAAEAERRDGE